MSDWVTLTQEIVNRFGEVTGSDDWTHTDPHRASSGPFGVPIAQGDLLLSRAPRLLHSTYRLNGDHVGMIYGSDRVRLPSSISGPFTCACARSPRGGWIVGAKTS